jgi:hypothetical protein
LKGNIQAHPEADEQYPRLKSQQRAVIQQLMTNPDPVVQAILREPDNLAFIKSAIGLTEIVIPGEDSRNKQLREIQQLLAGIPVAIDDLLDDHAVELEVCKRWANGDAGQTAKAENPTGFANVRAHAAAHRAALHRPM